MGMFPDVGLNEDRKLRSDAAKSGVRSGSTMTFSELVLDRYI